MPENSKTSQNTNHAKRLLASVENAKGIDRLLNLMQALRDPEGGCAWDRQQTYQSIIPFTIEEVYEVVETIENNDFDNLKQELGDLLFQIVFYAQLAKEENRFEFNDLVDAICDKLISRHPHVFADKTYQTEEELSQAWYESKQQEKKIKAQSDISILSDIPKSLPELKRADKIQKRVAKVGFDWDNTEQVWAKINEEIEEVKQAEQGNNSSHLEEEIGDLLFAITNLARHHKIDSDMALRKANQKFENRFRELERITEQPVNELTLEQMEALWQKVKLSEQ
jgi:ATP diphosphatase